MILHRHNWQYIEAVGTSLVGQDESWFNATHMKFVCHCGEIKLVEINDEGE